MFCKVSKLKVSNSINPLLFSKCHLVLLMGILEPFLAVTELNKSPTVSSKTLNLKLMNKKEVEIVHGWKSIRFKKDSLFSTENQNGAKGEGSHG